MINIGEVRQEFAVSMANSLMGGKINTLQASVDIYYFAIRSDIDVSTLAIASQVASELRCRCRMGEIPSKEAKKFLKHYKKASKAGRSIFFAPKKHKEQKRSLLEQAQEHGAFQPQLNALH